GRQLGCTALALLRDLLDLLARRRDPRVELVGLAPLEPDLALAEANPVIELVHVLLHADEPSLLDRELRALRHHVRVLRHPRGARILEPRAGLAQAPGDELVLGVELEPAMARLP